MCLLVRKRSCVKDGRRPQCLSLMQFLFLTTIWARENGSISVPLLPREYHCPLQRKRVKGDLRSFLLAITSKNKPLTIFFFRYLSRSRGSRCHWISGEIYITISPLDIVAITIIYLVLWRYCKFPKVIAKRLYFRTCEGGQAPLQSPPQPVRKLDSLP